MGSVTITPDGEFIEEGFDDAPDKSNDRRREEEYRRDTMIAPRLEPVPLEERNPQPARPPIDINIDIAPPPKKKPEWVH
ncbi:MAG: hypothetical protein AB7G06_06965 [Bdellovibrionales bacterium]